MEANKWEKSEESRRRSNLIHIEEDSLNSPYDFHSKYVTNHYHITYLVKISNMSHTVERTMDFIEQSVRVIILMYIWIGSSKLE